MYTIRHLSRKYLLLIPASIPFVGGCLFYLKQNFDNSISNSSLTNEYIYLPNELSRNLFLTDYDVGKINLDETDLAIEPNQQTNFTQSLYNSSTDLEALKSSQSNDFTKSIKLALTPNANFNSFRAPLNTRKILIRINEENRHFELDELMTHLLRCAHAVNVKEQSECAKYLTEQALVLFEHDVHLNDIFFTSEYGNKHFDNYHIKRYQGLYFQAILENILSSKEHAMCLLENGLLVLLHKLRELFPEKQMQNWISACLSALSFHEEAHLHLFHTGWIGILAQWLNSNDLRLNLEAAKALYNMAHKESLHRSLYILHPLQYSDSSMLKCDIVFIHGLQGGIFKTWRQSDTMKHTTDYTECWPKSWLANDFHDCRILAVNYQTFLSNWNVNCGQAYTLKEKSSQLAQELEWAKVGERPIIWITHSMGGLLVKEMLSQIDTDLKENSEENNSLLDQTKGIVFYSVPHKGSEMAVWSPNMQRIISPSNHVLELRKDSPTLIELNERFLDLVTRKQFDCLSFAEGKHSTLLRNPIEWKYLLVPEESANPGIGQFIVLPEDHFHICKPKDKTSESYIELQKFISRLVRSKSDLMQPLRNDFFLSSCVL